MRTIGIVVQRAGEDILGGAEGYSLSLAEALCEENKVEILTTTARDYGTWANSYPEGESELVRGKLKIRRFKVDCKRGYYWRELYRVLLRGMSIEKFASLAGEEREHVIEEIRHLPIGIAEEYVKSQGPYSIGLLDYLKRNGDRYDIMIFMTYLYAPTYFGIEAVGDRENVFIVPTFHDEPVAYLPVFLRYKDYYHLFLTEAEKRIAERDIYRCEVRNTVVGYGMEDQHEGEGRGVCAERYILYAGRLEEGKGVLELFRNYERYYNQNRDVKLYLIGDGDLKGYRHPGIVYRGFVDSQTKYRFMRNAGALVHPSRVESLGIVLVEAFMMGTPALVNGKSGVLREHIEKSGAGFAYENFEDFQRGMDRILNGSEESANLRRKAREYFLRSYSLGEYRKRLQAVFGMNGLGGR